MTGPSPTTRRRLLNLASYLLLSAIGLTMLVPFAWMISTSLKAPAYAVEFPPRWIPSEPTTVTIDGLECRVATVGATFLSRPRPVGEASPPQSDPVTPSEDETVGATFLSRPVGEASPPQSDPVTPSEDETVGATFLSRPVGEASSPQSDPVTPSEDETVGATFLSRPNPVTPSEDETVGATFLSRPVGEASPPRPQPVGQAPSLSKDQPVGATFLSRPGDPPSPDLRVAILRYSPEGALVQVLAPQFRAGEELTVSEDDLTLVRETKLHWGNYAEAWRAQGVRVREAFFGLAHQVDGFLVFYTNSIFVTICITLGTVFTSSLAAFAFARLRFPGRDAIFLGYLATLMVPAIVIMLPVYALLSNLRLTNTYAALILPPMFSAYGTFLLRQFFLTIPTELEDAAVIDGASPFQVYRHIILPLSKPALATLTTFIFLHSWNDFLWPLMVVDRLALKTLPIGLAHFQDSYTTDYQLLMAASVIVMIPVLIVFLLGQRYFVRGIALSGMKG